MRIAPALGVVAILAAWLVPQDPVKTRSKPSAESRPTSSPTTQPSDEQAERPRLPPIEEPFRSRVERRDLLQQFGDSSPLEGCYRLRAIVRNNVYVAGGVGGYVWFGRRHMSLHTVVSPAAAGELFLQAAVRTYRVEGDRLTMTTVLGHEHSGDLLLEAAGRVEVRRFRRSGAALRIYRDAGNYLEFVRVE